MHLLITASSFYIFTSLFHRKLSNLPPTVFPTLPIIDHLYLLKPPLYITFSKISAKYGPILLLHLGSRRVLLVSSPSAVEECFTKNDIVFANRPPVLYGMILGNNYTTLAWAPYGDNWRNLRRIASIKVLSVNCLNQFKDIHVDEVKLLIHKLDHHSLSSPVVLKPLFHELTSSVMMRMISGKRYFGGGMPEVEEEGKMFRQVVDDSILLAEAGNVGDYLPFLSWFGLKRFEKKLFDVILKKQKGVKVQTRPRT